MIREIDDNGDVKAGSFLVDAAEVAQDVKCQIQLWLRENPVNLGEGIDWKNELGERYSESRLSLLIKEVVLQVDGVKSVSKLILFDYIRETRTLNMNLSIITIFSDLPIGLEVGVNG